MKPRPVLSILATVALLAVSRPSAAVFVSGAVTPLGGSFHYDFSVENTGPEDYVIVSLTDAPLADPLIDPSLAAPTGFGASYDPGLRIVDLLEDSSFFAAGSLTSGFSFESLAGPSDAFSSFEALSLLGDSLSGEVDLTIIPEPAWTGLLVSFGLLGAAAVRRRWRL
jgi:hypothetical protein